MVKRAPAISFADFATFLTNKDYTSENLVFVLWHRNYKSKWKLLDKAVRIRGPVPSTSLGHRYDPFGYLRHGPVALPTRTGEREEEVSRNRLASANAYSMDATAASDRNDRSAKPLKSYFSRVSSDLHRSRLEASSLACSSSLTPASSYHPLHSLFSPDGTTFLSVDEQPLRDQAQRAFATFLKKGGSKELSISDELREYVRTCLEASTGPEYCVGAVDLLIGLTIFLLLTLLLPPSPFSLRIYRLFSIIFVSFGIMQVYSAYRGFCSQVWRRSNRQVWPWDLDALEDENAKVGDTMERSDNIRYEPKPQVRVLQKTVLPGEVRPLSNLGEIESFDSTCKVNIQVSENSTSASQTSLDNSGGYDIPSQTFDSCNDIAGEFVSECHNSSLGGKLGSISRPCCMRHAILTAKGHKLPIHIQRKISPFAFESGREGETGSDNATVTKPPPHSASTQVINPLTSSTLIQIFRLWSTKPKYLQGGKIIGRFTFLVPKTG
ncbi:hypothetical protein I352_05060 [Cryptococcus deuterogattii MMRL2647]|nr:hypothetical protein I352_05060 [Cryptococcus deuterogattii MMRL2647]